MNHLLGSALDGGGNALADGTPDPRIKAAAASAANELCVCCTGTRTGLFIADLSQLACCTPEVLERANNFMLGRSQVSSETTGEIHRSPNPTH